MADWQSRLARRLVQIENQFDSLKLWSKMKLGGGDMSLMIQPYIGHIDQQHVMVRGRVLMDNGVTRPLRTDDVWTNIVNMAKRFESDEIPGARVRANYHGLSAEATTDIEGFFDFSLPLEDGVQSTEFWQSVTLEILDTPLDWLDAANVQATAPLMAAPATAQFAVVSDLDDTVMRTDAFNVFKMLSNTILHNAYARLPFEGVAAFYRALRDGTTPTQNPIFYVSSSPWNLYDVIVDFFKIRHIPLGPIYLRDLGLSSESLFASGHMDHKLAYIQSLLNCYPDLPFILIGDSGQKDASIYLEAVRQNPGRIAVIYIRDVMRLKLVDEMSAIAEQVRDHGAEMLLVEDTLAAAEHAAANGWIASNVLEDIRHEVQQDEERASALERMTER